MRTVESYEASEFMRKRVEQLEAENAALREDKARLDWMQEAHEFAALTLRMLLTEQDDEPEVEVFNYNDERIGGPCRDVRAALDAARKGGKG